jgi:hypothetical protein
MSAILMRATRRSGQGRRRWDKEEDSCHYCIGPITLMTIGMRFILSLERPLMPLCDRALGLMPIPDSADRMCVSFTRAVATVPVRAVPASRAPVAIIAVPPMIKGVKVVPPPLVVGLG